MREYFNKNLIMTEEKEDLFQNSNNCWICKKLIDKFDAKIKVIPNGLEKYIAFFFNKNLLFVDSMPFMNSSLDKLVKNVPDKDFKYLIEEFGSENLELLKQKGTYPYKYMDRFNEEKLTDKKYFYSSIKDGKLVMMVKYQMVT